ncbi:MAG: recombination mediator RecR [Spirochaetaceae bacterium]|nr:recombination mediator RecR [Spirochaetaceae bacterium]
MKSFEELVKSFSRLPGVGFKSARKMAYFILQAEDNFVENFSKQLLQLKQLIQACPNCGFYSEGQCPICNDAGREQTICIVATAQEATAIEASGAYHGLYHILGGLLAPLDGIGPNELTIPALIKRLEENPVNEVIIATSPTLEGDATALYLQNILNNYNITISRLASGLAVGSDLEYADKQTISRSLKGRIINN